MTINFDDVVPKFDRILARGLCAGVGVRDGQMCIEAAICAAFDLPHGDKPECVASAVRAFKINLNDAAWSSPKARAAGLREIGIAQIGSRGIVDDGQFGSRLIEKIIRELIPDLYRRGAERFKLQSLKDAADRCEQEGTPESAARAARAARAASAAEAPWAAQAASAAWVAEAARAAWAARAASAAWVAEATRAARAARAAETAEAAADAEAPYMAGNEQDYYLRFVAKLAYQVLLDLKSPGALWLEARRVG